MRTRRKPGRWSGNYPPRSPAEWIDEKHVTCSIRCLNGDCRPSGSTRWQREFHDAIPLPDGRALVTLRR